MKKAPPTAQRRPQAGQVASEAAIRYHETKSIGYGPAPDSQVHYLSEGANLTQSSAWRGYYYLGARYYEPSSARFDSAYTRGAANIAGSSLAAIGGVAATTAAWGWGTAILTDTATVIKVGQAGAGIAGALRTEAGQRLVQTGSSGFEMGMEMLSGYAGPSMSAMGGLVDDVSDAGRMGFKNSNASAITGALPVTLQQQKELALLTTAARNDPNR